MTYIRVARHRDIALVGEAMRVRDVEEVRASSGHEPCEALRRALEASTHCWTICNSEGEPFAMFGAAPLGGAYGAPWMLATDEFAQHTMFILRHTGDYLSRMHGAYPVLFNYVDCRNQDSFRYLRAVGFRFTAFDPEYGVERRPFLQFTRVRHV